MITTKMRVGFLKSGKDAFGPRELSTGDINGIRDVHKCIFAIIDGQYILVVGDEAGTCTTRYTGIINVVKRSYGEVHVLGAGFVEYKDGVIYFSKESKEYGWPDEEFIKNFISKNLDKDVHIEFEHLNK